MKNQVLKIANEPTQIEMAYELIQKWLPKSTQEVAMISKSSKNVNFSHVIKDKSTRMLTHGVIFYIQLSGHRCKTF